MPYCKRNGIKIYYEAYGIGPPMVFVHANPFDHRLWLYQLAKYSTTNRVVAVDLRGYGRSDKPTEAFTLWDMAQDVLSVCAEESITEAAFLGVSVGSGIAMLIATENPQIVSKLVLVGGASRGATSMQARIEGFLSTDLPSYHLQHLSDCVTPEFANSPTGKWLLGIFSKDSQHLSGVCIANIFRARLACDLTEKLFQIRAPTLVINGEYDASMPAGLLTAEKITGALHQIIPGAGHACNIERPEIFDALMVDFLGGI